MEDNTAKLIEHLASKLGTTTEYLWQVLIKQAAISAINNLILIVLTVLLGCVLYKLHRKFIKVPKDEKYNENMYETYELAIIGPMVLGTVLLLILMVCSIGSIRDIITALCNPEYWALEQILNSVR